ncbi:MAG: hypothetical protein O7D30_08465 [Rickettsia endosymbiont of Ixodes persulcatus]|nr:hypothetical protein [Rickettsia endosymbiont of Ixodes persulcatus]
MHGLLALYPFVDPQENEKIILPQKINGQWIRVEYQFEKIDISPQTGLLAKWLEDKDRIYAYGLRPSTDAHPDAESHLLLMGTTYPTGQGAALGNIYNFLPGNSVGEGHDTTHLDAWIKNQAGKVKVSGQSKGATMAMITAVRHPNKVSEAHCLNPTALNLRTLNRLERQWDSLAQKPQINIYDQNYDPVFPLENGFLKDVNIYKIYPDKTDISSYFRYMPSFMQRAYEAHIHNFAGRESALVLRGSIHRENISRKREFFGDMKEGINVVIFPLGYLHLYTKLRTRHWHAAFKKPIVAAESILNKVLCVALLPPIMLLSAIISGVKTLGRMITNSHYDYQKATSPVPLPFAGGSPYKLLHKHKAKTGKSQYMILKDDQDASINPAQASPVLNDHKINLGVKSEAISSLRPR